MDTSKKQLVTLGIAQFFEANPPKLEGIGHCCLPGLPSELQPQSGDMSLDPVATYSNPATPEEVKSWIRRAASAEVFAKALETELEVLRTSVSLRS